MSSEKSWRSGSHAPQDHAQLSMHHFYQQYGINQSYSSYVDGQYSRRHSREADENEEHIARSQSATRDHASTSALTISSPFDASEREAKSFANQVSTGASHNLSATATPAMAAIQRSETQLGTPPVPTGFEAKLRSTKGSGTELDSSLRSNMETRTGTDLSDVRVHEGAAAGAMANSIQAKAFTHGQDIYAGQGKLDGATMAEEVMHTVQNKAGAPANEIRRAFDPKLAVDEYFKDVADYSWDNYLSALGLTDSGMDRMKAYHIMEVIANANARLDPARIYDRLINKPTKLKGLAEIQSELATAGGLPEFERDSGELEALPDLESDTGDLRTNQVAYQKRRHFIFGKKATIRKRDEANAKANALVQGSVDRMDKIVSDANAYKAILERDAQLISDQVNEKLLRDALEKKQMVELAIPTVQTMGKFAKVRLQDYLWGSEAVIRKNTETQKAKLEEYRVEILDKLERMFLQEEADIRALYAEFDAKIMEVAGNYGDVAIIESGEKAAKLKEKAAPAGADALERVVTGVGMEVDKDIFNAGLDAIIDARGWDNDDQYNHYDGVSRMEELAFHDLTTASGLINQRYEEAVRMLDSKAEQEMVQAKQLKKLYDKNIDFLVVKMVASLTEGLETYYSKLRTFGADQDAAVQAFYASSVASLDLSTSGTLEQTKIKLSDFRDAQTGQRTPRKKQMEASLSGLEAGAEELLQKSASSQGAEKASTNKKLEALKTSIRTATDEFMTKGTITISELIGASTKSINTLKQEAFDAQKQLRIDHVNQIIRQVRKEKKEWDVIVEEMAGEYDAILLSLEKDLEARITEFEKEAERILNTLDQRIDDKVSEQTPSGLKQMQDVYDFDQARITLMGTEELYKLHNEFSWNIAHKTRYNAMTVDKQARYDRLLELYKQHGFTSESTTDFMAGVTEGNRAYQRVIFAFQQGFKDTVSATALDMIDIYERQLNQAEADFNDPVKMQEIFDHLGTYRGSVGELEAEIAYSTNLRRTTSANNSVHDEINRKRTRTNEDRKNIARSEERQKEIKQAGRAEFRKLYDKYPIFNDEDYDAWERIDKQAVGHANTVGALRAVLMDYIADRRKSIKKARKYVKKEYGTNEVYSMDTVIPAVLENFNITSGSVHDQIIQKQIKAHAVQGIIEAILLAIVAIVLTIISLGAATPAIVAGAAAVGAFSISAYGFVQSLQDYERGMTLADVGLISEDPSLFWVVLSFVGMVVDAGAFVKVIQTLKAVKPAAEVLDATGDIARFGRVVANLERVGEIEAKMADRVMQAAKARTGFNKAMQSLSAITRNTPAGVGKAFITPKAYKQIAKIAYYKMREGITNFDHFLLSMKRHYRYYKILKDTDDFAPADLARLKAAWKQAKGEIDSGRMISGTKPNGVLARAILDKDYLKALSEANRVIKHLGGEVKQIANNSGTRTKLRLKGYHYRKPEVAINPPFSGPTSKLDPAGVNGYTNINITTPASKGKVHITDEAFKTSSELPYTAKITIEIPPGSGQFFPKVGRAADASGASMSGRSSMFPSSWTPDRIAQEIAYVRRNLRASDFDAANGWYSGLSSDGTFKIAMYVNGNLSNFTANLGSAFPLVP